MLYSQATFEIMWDLLHGLEGTDRHTDIDVVYFDPEDVSVERDIRLEELLRTTTANPKWSVKNQARMHVKNGDEPYNSTQRVNLLAGDGDRGRGKAELRRRA